MLEPPWAATTPFVFIFIKPLRLCGSMDNCYISPPFNLPVCVCWFQMRKLKGSDEHLSVERAGGGQEVLVSLCVHHAFLYTFVSQRKFLLQTTQMKGKLHLSSNIHFLSKHSFMCLLKQLNTMASLSCLIAGSLIQHVALQHFRLLHSWSEGKVQLLCSAVMRKAVKRWEKIG